LSNTKMSEINKHLEGKLKAIKNNKIAKRDRGRLCPGSGLHCFHRRFLQQGLWAEPGVGKRASCTDIWERDPRQRRTICSTALRRDPAWCVQGGAQQCNRASERERADWAVRPGLVVRVRT
jgi:hypothetical protein